MKVAIVCDWLTGTGGAERVVLELHKMFPDAPIYTSQYNRDPRVWYGDIWFSDADVRTGWLQWIPKSLKKFLPIFRAWYFSHLDLSQYDLVISSSGAEAKGVKTGPKTIHVCYCHSPTHYYWMRYEDYLKEPGFGRLDPLARLALRFLVGPLRRWDWKAAQNPDYLVANSTHTQNMIMKYYGLESSVVHPPVDIERFENTANEERRGFITAGRQTPYKRIDLAVAAATELNAPLLVIGNGPAHRKLERIAGKSVTFLTGKSDEEVAHYFATSEAFILPNADDFGIVAIEALASGTPVIAFKGGGALDYITADCGQFFDKQTTDSLLAVMKNFSASKYDAKKVSAAAARFSPANFRQNFQKLLKEKSINV